MKSRLSKLFQPVNLAAWRAGQPSPEGAKQGSQHCGRGRHALQPSAGGGEGSQVRWPRRGPIGLAAST